MSDDSLSKSSELLPPETPWSEEKNGDVNADKSETEEKFHHRKGQLSGEYFGFIKTQTAQVCSILHRFSV
jgi:hypothetical protein